MPVAPRSGSGGLRPGVPDPCATFRDIRRDYCYAVMRDMMNR
ncbi:hypothetical protein ACFFMN_33390 [Planobispora siamensis]|nr:hypothetical protein [Planobispora siamensis]